MVPSYTLALHGEHAFDPATHKAVDDVFENHTPQDLFRGFLIALTSDDSTRNPQRVLALMKTEHGVQGFLPSEIAPDIGHKIGYAVWLLGCDMACERIGYQRRGSLERHTYVAVGPRVLVTWRPSRRPLLARRDNPDLYQHHLDEDAPLAGAVQFSNTSAHESLERLAHLTRLAQDVYDLQVRMSRKKHLIGHFESVSFGLSQDILNPSKILDRDPPSLTQRATLRRSWI